MTKNILIPIDFCVASLNTLRLVLEENKTHQVSVILVYAEYLTDSEMDLLFYSPQKIISKNITTEFKEALEVLKNRYSSLKQVAIKLLHTDDSGYIENFLSGNQIDEVHLPKSYKLRTPSRAFDPVGLLRQVTVPVFEKDWEQYLNKTEQEYLIALFN